MTQMQIGTIYPDDAFEGITDGDVVTSHRVIVDGYRDEEVVVHDPIYGACSVAPASSGIPSAITQLGHPGSSEHTGQTAMAGRLQRQIQNLTP
jgi:hypothetical protein